MFTVVNTYPTEEALKNIYEMTFETNKNIAFIYSQLFPIMLAGKEGTFLRRLWSCGLDYFAEIREMRTVVELEGLGES